MRDWEIYTSYSLIVIFWYIDKFLIWPDDFTANISWLRILINSSIHSSDFRKLLNIYARCFKLKTHHVFVARLWLIAR